MNYYSGETLIELEGTPSTMVADVRMTLEEQPYIFIAAGILEDDELQLRPEGNLLMLSTMYFDGLPLVGKVGGRWPKGPLTILGPPQVDA